MEAETGFSGTMSLMTKHDIPLARPNITRAEIDAVVSVLETPILSLGPKVAEFEEAFAAYCGTTGAVACSSGTAGLHLLMTAYGVGPGHAVVSTPFPFLPSPNCPLITVPSAVFADLVVYT